MKSMKKSSTYHPDPTQIEPERRIAVEEMDRRIRQEDKENLVLNLVAGGDDRFIDLKTKMKSNQA